MLATEITARAGVGVILGPSIGPTARRRPDPGTQHRPRGRGRRDPGTRHRLRGVEDARCWLPESAPRPPRTRFRALESAANRARRRCWVPASVPRPEKGDAGCQHRLRGRSFGLSGWQDSAHGRRGMGGGSTGSTCGATGARSRCVTAAGFTCAGAAPEASRPRPRRRAADRLIGRSPQSGRGAHGGRRAAAHPLRSPVLRPSAAGLRPHPQRLDPHDGRRRSRPDRRGDPLGRGQGTGRRAGRPSPGLDQIPRDP